MDVLSGVVDGPDTCLHRRQMPAAIYLANWDSIMAQHNPILSHLDPVACRVTLWILCALKNYTPITQGVHSSIAQSQEEYYSKPTPYGEVTKKVSGYLLGFLETVIVHVQA